MFQTQKGLGNPYGEDTIDIKALLGRFLKRWYYFAIGLVVFGSIGVYKIYTAEKIYAVKARAILGDPNKAASKEQGFEGLFDDQSTVDDKIGVMTSYNLLREAVKALPIGVSYYSKEPLRYREVFTGAPFQVEIDSSHVQLAGFSLYCSRIGDQLRLKGEGEKIWLYDIGEDRGIRELEEFTMDETIQLIPTAEGDSATFENDLLKFSIRYDKAWETYPDKEYFFKINTVDGLVDMIQNSISVGVAGEGSNIIDISMEGPVVDIQKMVINQLLVTYQKKELAEMKVLGNKTVIYLDSLIRDLKGETTQLNNEKTQTMGRGGVAIGQTDNTLTQAEQSLLTTKGDLESQLSYYVTIKEKLEQSTPSEVLQLPTSSIGESDGGLATLINNLSVFQEDRIRMEATDTRGPKWEINEIQIQNTRRAILANVSSSVDAYNIRLNSIVEQINSIRAQRGALPIEVNKIEIIEGDLAIKNEQLTKLRDRKLQAELAVESAKVDIEIIENARMDGTTPIKPKKPLTLLIFGFLGLVLPLAVILARDFFDNKIASHEDIQSSTNLPVLGFIARHDRNSNYIVPKDSRTALAESFRSIRIKMQYLNDNVHQQVVGVTSSSSGEGKTFCVTNIAAIMAQAGKKTLLIDMDLRRPRVTRYFDNPEGLGLSNYLAGEVEDVKSIVAETHIENLHVIHSGPVATNPLDLIATDRMTHLMETFREEFDHIVLDAPPVGLVSDYLIIMKMTDFNIYVVRDSATTIESLRMINELYDSQKIKNIAMLINDVKSVSAYGYIDKHYGYGD